ncbi:cellulose binding domain-containing protein [Phytohabitans houttuyneae]|uniref:cellulose binding domain-containing protein n=1 Tax=Phytohabitans houttuyneae TaxID=1076126 RepID=UPI0031E9EFFC
MTYRIVGSWPGGFQGEVQIAPNLAISAWSVSWSFANAQRINQLWSGSHSQNGAACSG